MAHPSNSGCVTNTPAKGKKSGTDTPRPGKVPNAQGNLVQASSGGQTPEQAPTIKSIDQSVAILHQLMDKFKSTQSDENDKNIRQWSNNIKASFHQVQKQQEERHAKLKAKEKKLHDMVQMLEQHKDKVPDRRN